MKTTILGALFTLAGLALGQEEGGDIFQQPLGIDLENYVCEDPRYEIHIFSRDPLVIYISDFVTPSEQEHLIKITNGTFARSNVALSDGGHEVSEARTSSSTTVGPDPVVNCIGRRAQRFQGLSIPNTRIEPIQLVRYEVGEQYHTHTDWFPVQDINNGHGSVPRGGNRISSFFAYVDVSEDFAGGGTHFPKLPAPSTLKNAATGGDWCKFVECDDEWDRGVTFRAIKGNAVFWTNMIDEKDGKRKGDDRTLHAGLPVLTGHKLGMNIWTKEADYV